MARFLNKDLALLRKACPLRQLWKGHPEDAGPHRWVVVYR
jgi:hypothetical protein